MRCDCMSSLYNYYLYTTLLVVLLLVLRATPLAIPITRVMVPTGTVVPAIAHCIAESVHCDLPMLGALQFP